MHRTRWLGAVIGMMVTMLLMGCEQPASLCPIASAEPEGVAAQEILQTPQAPALQIEPWQEGDCYVSAWAAYWDVDNVVTELKGYTRLEALCYFEAYFDPKGKVILPREIPALYKKVKKEFPNAGWTSYLTFVNDRYDGPGEFSLKDTELLWTLLGSEASMTAHVEDIVALVKDKGFDGIEIDYEAIRKDMPLWEKFLAFCEALYARASQEGLVLRVLLEPSTPFDSLTFPAGPTYVMMCYNLYGGHSGAGPKADAAFISELVQKMQALPGRKDFAIATGGFDWCGDSVQQLTETGAKSLAATFTVSEEWRDEASRCVAFRYADEKGNSHEVWYADQVTLDFWASLIRTEDGDGISIWRLGGNQAVVQ
ncbi:MAG: glycosyl hydrolase family 18 protein [Candidatus Pelethousia sp.]|nr:glycosyl hydrolase family 18 protein [Candidatus Pelethousia sp.]